MVGGPLIKVAGKVGSVIVRDKVLDAAVAVLTDEQRRQQIVALGKAAAGAARNGAASVNKKMPWYRDLEAEYAAIAIAVEQAAGDIAAATADPQAPIDDWTKRLQRVTTAIPQARAAIGKDELKRVKQILKNTRSLQAEIYRFTMGEQPKVVKAKLALPKGLKKG